MFARVRRALEQPIEYNYETSDGTNDVFEINGSTGNTYIVTIESEKQSTCTCCDFQKRRKMCKHIMCVLMKHYGLNISQLDQLDKNEYHGLNDVLRTSFKYDISDECPICFQKIDNIFVWQCDQCKNNFHFACISDWFRIQSLQRIIPSCPMCRKSAR